MNDDESFYNSDYIEIPDLLKSFETGKPISHCVNCGTQLLGESPLYSIQKAYQNSEVLVEYAQCFNCYEELTASYSRQTMSGNWNFSLDSRDFEGRKQRLLKEAPQDLELWIENCLTCGKGKDEMSSYTLVGQCEGSHLLFYYMPYLICEDCQIRMHDFMSSKSRDIWNRWYEGHIGTPPVMEREHAPGKVVLV